MTIDTWANIGVSIGTLSLAFLTFIIVKSSNKQMIFLKNQQKLMKNQLNPFLQVFEVSFFKNTMSFKSKNIGAGNAYEVGIETHFEPVILTDLAGNDDDTLFDTAKIAFKFKDIYEIEDTENRNRKWIEVFNKGILREYYPRLWFERINKKLIDSHTTDNSEIKSNHFVTFANTKYTNFVITPHENDELFTCEPLFNAEYIDVNSYIPKSSSKSTTISRHFNLDELISVIKHNDIHFFNIVFKLVYKNQFEDALESVPLANFVFSIKEHATLEEAFEQDFSIGNIIGYREIEQKLKGVSYFQYIHSKSSRNSYE